jgi:hypothetical protein
LGKNKLEHGQIELPSYHGNNLPDRLRFILRPSTFRREAFFRRIVFARIKDFEPYGIEHVTAVYQEEQLRLYTIENKSHLIAIIQFAYHERHYLLGGIGPHCIRTWIPRTNDFRLLVAKIIRSTLPEYFGKELPPPPTYRVLMAEEYLQNDFYSDLLR